MAFLPRTPRPSSSFSGALGHPSGALGHPSGPSGSELGAHALGVPLSPVEQGQKLAQKLCNVHRERSAGLKHLYPSQEAEMRAGPQQGLAAETGARLSRFACVLGGVLCPSRLGVESWVASSSHRSAGTGPLGQGVSVPSCVACGLDLYQSICVTRLDVAVPGSGLPPCAAGACVGTPCVLLGVGMALRPGRRAGSLGASVVLSWGWVCGPWALLTWRL